MDKLYKIAEKENIDIEFKSLDSLNALCMAYDDNALIYISNKIDDNIKKKMTLAEEIAHYKVGMIPTLPLANDYYSKLIRSKNEFKAFKWMQSNLIPYDIKSLKYESIWDIADRFEVTPEFVQKVLEYRKESKNG